MKPTFKHGINDSNIVFPEIESICKNKLIYKKINGKEGWN